MTNLRQGLYRDFKYPVIYNPVDEAETDYAVIDLTVDVSNLSSLNHFNTKEVRAVLKKAKIVIADSPMLAKTISGLDNVLVTSAYYGTPTTSRRGGKISSKGLAYGIFNHSTSHKAINSASRDFLKRLNVPFVTLGDGSYLKLDEEVKEVEDFEQFVASVDIALIPALPGSYISPTLILSLAASGVPVVVTHTPVLYFMQAASAVELVEGKPSLKTWEKVLKRYKDTNYFLGAQIRNQKFAETQNQQAQEVLRRIERRVLLK